MSPSRNVTVPVGLPAPGKAACTVAVSRISWPADDGFAVESRRVTEPAGLTVWETVAADFSDIPDAAQATRVTVRLLLAALLGGAVGFEREHRGKAAGMRTHMLVALGSCLFTVVPLEKGADITRVIQGIAAGIGFLGAGTILLLFSTVSTVPPNAGRTGVSTPTLPFPSTTLIPSAS